VIYALAFSGRQKTYLVPRLLVTAPFLLCIALALSPSAVAFISNDTASGATRLAMLPVLLTLAADNPLFGTGTGSAQDVSLQTVYGAFFHPSDWGLLGLGVTHGLTGVLITLCILLANLRNAVEAERTAPPPLRFFAAGLVLNALFLLTGYVTFSPLAASDGNAAMVLTLLFSKILQLESCKPENRHGSGPSE
jgi:O-antigen ligase